jgi:hypothetical protein
MHGLHTTHLRASMPDCTRMTCYAVCAPRVGAALAAQAAQRADRAAVARVRLREVREEDAQGPALRGLRHHPGAGGRRRRLRRGAAERPQHQHGATHGNWRGRRHRHGPIRGQHDVPLGPADGSAWVQWGQQLPLRR